ncbi:MAG TPA: hypothetical protein VHO70_23305 [Chitinispirillaceae bacterium]|nr:hypothetical protein [Chitinispirillaceae bacterium]
MANKSPEERLAELDEKMKQIKAQKRALQNRAKTEERKKRTRHLIEIGGVVEKYCGSITDLKSFERYISQYANAIKSTQKGSVVLDNPEH